MKKQVEVWKTIEDFPNYMISNYGNVWSKNKNSIRKAHTLSVSQNHDGYYTVQLWRHNHGYKRRINRLVAKEFVPNPHHYPIVNHKDENKHNNYYKNLEWCTNSYNIHYSLKRHPSRQKSWFNKHEYAHTPLILYKNRYKVYYFTCYQKAAQFLHVSQQLLEGYARNDHTINDFYLLPFTSEARYKSVLK